MDRDGKKMRLPGIALVGFAALAGLLLVACGGAGASEALSVGDRAPDFTLPEAGGSSVSLSDYRGEPVLLYFHMADG